jgi:hypothetical protein
MAIVTKWGCTYCGEGAQKSRDGQRWIIVHRHTCTDAPNASEDVGPVTSVNDPDNVLLLPDD